MSRRATGYNDRVVVTRGGSGGGSQDPVTGVWTADDDADVIYDGPANVQAGGLLRASRRATGEPMTSADGQFIVPKNALADLLNMEPGDVAHVGYHAIRDGTAIVHYGADAEITFVRPEDRTALLRYR